MKKVIKLKAILKIAGIIVFTAVILFSMTGCDEKDCTYCHGSGKCNPCNGTGIESYNFNGNLEQHTCLSCGGSGICSHCDGTGRVKNSSSDWTWHGF